MDIYLVPLDGDDSDNENSNSYEPVDKRENPEEGLMRRESEREAAGFVEQFLASLNEAVRGKVKQYNRIIGVLWYCYLSPDHATQLEVAAVLGVSDSLVSDYRRVSSRSCGRCRLPRLKRRSSLSWRCGSTLRH